MAHRLTLAPLPIETAGVVFDITRLYRNRLSAFGTGVDRIDLAIGRDLASRFGLRCRFVHVCYGGFAEMSRKDAMALMSALDDCWHNDGQAGGRNLAAPLALGRLRAALGQRFGEDSTYVVASHSGLPQRSGYLDRFDPDRRLRRLAYIHDLIPLEYPEYQTPRSRMIFRRYLQELTAAPLQFVVNSVDTGRRLSAYCAAKGWSTPPPLVAIPSLEATEAAPPPPPPALQTVFGAGPVFVILGTIEPRKNHLVLLQIWREMAAKGVAPHLLVIGKRGWMNNDVIDILDNDATIRPVVTEATGLTDKEISGALAASSALLFPSFAEGLGIPMLEARAAGLPVIASDLPALREIAAPGTVFLDPHDRAKWLAAIIERCETSIR